jgi:hypothetical protein
MSKGKSKSKNPPLTVQQLREALAELPADLPVVVNLDPRGTHLLVTDRVEGTSAQQKWQSQGLGKLKKQVDELRREMED